MSLKVKSQKRVYEMIFMASNTLGSSGIENLIRSISDLLVENNISIISNNYCGLFDLKYNIRRNNRAHYIIFYIENVELKNIKEFERKINLNAVIMRHLFLKKDSFDKEVDTGMFAMPLENKR